MSGNLEPRQIEEEIEELEGRLDRLRALYEQYFMGLEKLEPQIPRKDVERRFYVLRREQIRNTGMRFRFQMLVQRFNTFQQYWGRTTREIENGTYRRDVMRAAKRIGEKEAVTIVGKRRAEKYARLASHQQVREAAKGEGPPIEDPSTMDETDDAPTPARLGPVSARVPPAPLLPFAPRAPAAAPQRSAEPLEPRPEQRPNVPVPRESDPDAARRRVAAIAAEMRNKGGSGAKPAAADPGDLDLDLSSRPPPPLPRPPPRRGSSGRMKAVRPPEAVPPPSRPAVPDPHLSEQRVREIYSKYVETKRTSNESTAGLTYDKVAESLRAQANKLRATHPNRKVDYEVVVKDGKTLLKPVLK